jgi:glycosyltransferase involved in cell wall biosynthesis
VEEFIGASELVGRRFPEARFLLVGDGEKDNPQTISSEYLKARESNNFRWLGWRQDIREILVLTDIAVLPARYREGTPKSLLEAMAMGKPIVTTAVPGCKEVVDDGKNGYLIPPKDLAALAEAVSRLVLRPDLRASFGACSRRKAEVEFNQEQVNARIFAELYRV